MSQDPDEAWWVALNNIDPQRDTAFHSRSGRCPGPRRAAAALWQQAGDLMPPASCPGEGFTRPWPERIEMSPEVRAKIDGSGPSSGWRETR